METTELSNRIKQHRNRTGLSQDQLATESGLNLRTIQRIENGETVPRGDSLRRLAIALGTSPDELINWKTKEDKNVLTVLNLSQLSFIAFPILGIIVPLIIWILQKDKIKSVEQMGKSILNFQITWALIFFTTIGIGAFFKITHIDFGAPILTFALIFYAYNILIITLNLILNWTDRQVFYKPAFRILN